MWAGPAGWGSIALGTAAERLAVAVGCQSGSVLQGHCAIRPLRYYQLGIIWCRKAMNDAHSKPIQRHPYILGHPAGTVPRSTIGTSICCRMLGQLPAIQQLTSNKTFPVICDQYTIKQSHCQCRFLRSPKRQVLPHFLVTQPTASASPSFSQSRFSARRHSNVITERFIAV